jgi:uncharacterized repeat protein (TIGR01451 family)
VTDNTQGLDAASIVASQTIVGGQLAKTDGCVVVAPQVKCTIKALSGGFVGTQTITISGTVQQSAGSSIFNTATVTGNVKNTGVSNTASAVTTIRPQIDLTITKSGAPNPVCANSWPQAANRSTSPPDVGPFTPPDFISAAGGAPTPLLATPVCLGGLRYDFVVGNSGNGPATNVVVRDPLPAGVTLDSYATDGGFGCSVEALTQIVTCTGGTIPAAQTRRIAFLVVAPSYLGTIANTATVDPNNAIFEADETNNMVTQTTTVSTGIDLVVWKGDKAGTDPPGGALPLAEGFDPIATNGTETYTIIVDNVGTQDSTGIKVRDTLPAGTKFLSVVPDALHSFTCSHDGSATGGNVTCVGGRLFGTQHEFYVPPGTLGPGPGDDFATIKIKVFATPFVQLSGQLMHNEVRVDPDNEIPEVNELNNLATEDTTVDVGNANRGAFNQLTIDKTQVDPAPTATPPDPDKTVATNGTLVYNLHVSNLGTDPVSNVTVRDFLPDGTRFISAKDSDSSSPARFFCTQSAGVVNCINGDLSGTPNAISGVPTSRDIVIKVFAPNAPGVITNHATVDPDNAVPEGNEFDNDSSVDTTVTVGGNNMFNELNLTKEQTTPASGTNVATSTPVTYTLTVKNDGSDPAFQILVRDTLPAGFVFISADDGGSPGDPNAFNCTNTANVVNCTSARIDGGGATRTIKVKAFSATQPGTYVNQAVVDPNNAIPEGNETNNTAQASTKVVVGAGFVDLKVGKTADKTSVLPGGTITYTLNVSNAGTDPAFNVKVRDDLPDHTTFLSAVDTTTADGAFSCSLVGSSILCTGGTLDGTTDQIPGSGTDDVPASRTIEIKVQAPASISQFVSDQSNIFLDVFNRAIVDPDNTIPESNETNNASQSVKTTVSPAINLTTTKDGPGSASQNETTTYTITVTNNKVGDGAVAHGVAIVDPLPVGLIPLNVEATTKVGEQAGNFACQIQENPVNNVLCIGDLAPDEKVTVTISAFVTLQSGTLDNEACADPNNTIAETNELDNCQHKISQVTDKTPDLQINKTADKSSVTAGDTLTYTLSASNVGTGDTTASLSVSDHVPDELKITNINPDVGWDCSGSSIASNSVLCTMDSLAAGASAQIVVTTTVNGASPLTVPFTNTAQIIGGGESNATNNESSVTTSLGTANPIDLKVVSITDTPDPVNRSDKLTYTSIVRNDGTSGAPGAIIRVALPNPGVSNPAVSATNGFNCAANTALDSSGNTFDCTGDFTASGTSHEATTITAEMTVDTAAPDELKLTVTADPANAFVESLETNNTLSETTTVSGTVCTGSPCVDLVTTVFGDPLVFSPPGIINYSASVTNIGDSAVPNSPAWKIDLQYLGAGVATLTGSSGASCPPLGLNHFVCTSDASNVDPLDLGPGQGLTFSVQVIGSPPGAGTLMVNADSGGVVSEFSESNNIGLWLTNVVPHP